VSDPFARTVLIANFGFSREWTMGLLFAFVMLILRMIDDKFPRIECSLSWLGRWTEGFELRLPTGKLAFVANQVSFHMPAPERALDLASVLLLSLDDVHAADNQFEYHVAAPLQRLALADLVAAGFTVRTNDNRLSETWGRAFYSILSAGVLNTAADNQSTHCLSTFGLRTAVNNNLVLGELFCPELCSGGSDGSDLTPDLLAGTRGFFTVQP